MTEQTVGPGRVSALRGIAIIAGILLCLLLGSFAGNALMYLGLPNLYATIAFWAFGVALAAYVFLRFAVSYMYKADGVKFIVERLYGGHARLIEQLLKREIVFIGTLEQARANYEDARVTRATKRGCALPAWAVVFKREGEHAILLVQIDDDIKAKLAN